MWYDGNSKEIVFDDGTRVNVCAFVTDDAILESVAYDEEEEALTLYVRLMPSIKSINVNYVITRDGNTESIENGTVRFIRLCDI